MSAARDCTWSARFSSDFVSSSKIALKPQKRQFLSHPTQDSNLQPQDIIEQCPRSLARYHCASRVSSDMLRDESENIYNFEKPARARPSPRRFPPARQEIPRQYLPARLALKVKDQGPVQLHLQTIYYIPQTWRLPANAPPSARKPPPKARTPPPLTPPNHHATPSPTRTPPSCLQPTSSPASSPKMTATSNTTPKPPGGRARKISAR